MTIHVSSEIEALIQRDVERGLYESADEFVERAVRMLHEQEEWFVENHSEIAAMIKEGLRLCPTWRNNRGRPGSR